MSMQRSFNRRRTGHIIDRDEQNFRFATVVRLWKELEHNRWLLVLVLFTVVIHSLLGITGPYLLGYTVDELIYVRKTFPISILLVGLIAVYLCYSLTSYLQYYWMIGISQRTVFRIRTRLFNHFQALPIAFFDKRQHGELMSRITNDMDNVSMTLNSSIIQIISSVITLTGTVIVMVSLSPLLTLVTLIIVPLMVIGMRWITRRTGPLFRKQQRLLGDLNGYIEEMISGQRIIKIYSREEQVMDEFQQKNEALRNASYWAQVYSGFIPKLMNLLNNLSFALITFVGGIFALKGWVTVGVIITFAEYARQFTRPLNELANQFNTMLSALAGAERVYAILDTEKETDRDRNVVNVREMKGEVVYQNVAFSYGEKEETVSDINFHVRPGETVALVGPTGAGKTTIINLLSRFYEVQKGAILIDGRDVRSISRESLREQLGFVLQDVFLFEGTIRENIRYGRLDATDEEVEEAAMQANADEFIRKLPDGYDTVLSQDGAGISQGQKQLIAIARAILRDPAILILDEATSNIDTVTELKIQEALTRLMENRTTFVIAHRLNTIQNADQILVINEGRIIERGTHESLIKEKGFYYQLYSTAARKSG
mgnify:CR=1 FL=1